MGIMKNLLNVFLFSILIFGMTETSFSSERGGNTGDFEALEQAINQRKLFGSCAEDTNRMCREASRYLNQELECRDILPTMGCDFFREVEDYSATCCSGIDG